MATAPSHYGRLQLAQGQADAALAGRQTARGLMASLVLLDRNTEKGSFSCTVTMQDIVTGHRQHLDPTIRNYA